MVVIHFKRSEQNQFLYEISAGISIDDLTQQLVELNNLRLKIDRAAVSLEDLAAKGPLKPEGLRGLDEAGYEQYLKGEDVTVT